MKRKSASHRTLSRLFQEAAEAWKRQDYQQTIETLERATRLDPANSRILLDLGRAHGLRYDHGAAERCLEKAVRVAPQRAEALAEAGQRCQEFGNDAMARRYFERAAEQRGSSPSVCVTLAELSERHARLEEAGQWVDRALASHPDHPAALLTRARLSRLGGNPEEAESRLRSLLTHSHQDARTRIRSWYELGEVLDRQARYDEAMAAFLEAKALLRPAAATPLSVLHGIQARLREMEATISASVLERWFDSQESLPPARRLAVLCGHPRSGTTLLEQVLDSHDVSSTERFTYDISVLADTTVLSGPTTVTFLSDATKSHPVIINYTGGPGQALELRIERVASTLADGETEGDAFNIAVDDISLAQDPATILGGPSVESVSPAHEEASAPAIYSYRAGIRDGFTAVVPGSIQLKLDGNPVVPAPLISSAGGLTQLNFQAPGLFEAGSLHTYTLTYTDNAVPASSYTHEVQFTAADYLVLPSNYANPSSSRRAPGFTCRTVLAAGASGLSSTIARAKEQLNGTLMDPGTGSPFENAAAAGPNPDGSFDIATVPDFDNEGSLSGNFAKDVQFPGLAAVGIDWFSTEAWFYLDLLAGYHRLGVNSDDGFEVSAGTPAQGEFTEETVLGLFDNGRAAANTLFDFVVPTSGLYRFRLIVFESTGLASCEFFSVNLATQARERILINDLANPNSIKSFGALGGPILPPRITSVVRSGSDVTVQWIDGTPPFQVQFSNSLLPSGWSNLGAPTANRTATIPRQPGAGFIRVAGQ